MVIKVTKPEYDKIRTNDWETEDLPPGKDIKCPVCKGQGKMKTFNDAQQPIMIRCPNVTCVGGFIKKKFVNKHALHQTESPQGTN